MEDNTNDQIKQNIQNFISDGVEDENLGAKIEEVFDLTDDLNEIQEKVHLLICEHSEEVEKIEDDLVPAKEEVQKSIKKLIKNYLEGDLEEKYEYDEDLGFSKKDKEKYKDLTIESKKNLKRLIKNFSIYTIYKVMNPRRIAGETKRDNYRHNLAIGGEKLAKKHTGGKPSDLKKYGEAATKKMQKSARAFRKKGASFIR